MSTLQRILRSGDVSTPVDSVPLSFPQRLPRGHQSPVKETAAELFADDNVVAAPAKEKGEGANKKKVPAASRSSKQAGAAPRTKKRNKKSAEESSKKDKRQEYFSQDEDFMLCCAYVNVSVDPIIGVGQKSETFWTQILEKYLLLTEKHLSDNGEELPVRNSASLQQRWKKKIASLMQLWNKFYREIKSVKHSGWNEDNYVKEASKLYNEEVGKAFGLEKCVVVLHKWFYTLFALKLENPGFLQSREFVISFRDDFSRISQKIFREFYVIKTLNCLLLLFFGFDWKN